MQRLLALVFLLTLPSIGLTQQPDLSGRWSGYWISNTNGHRGPLRAYFVPIDADTYHVTYRGRFWLVFPFRYTTTMAVIGTSDGIVLLSAEKRLGLIGTFRTTAVASASSFNATYSSRNDRGRLVLRR